MVWDRVLIGWSGRALLLPRAETICVLHGLSDGGLPVHWHTVAETGHGEGNQHQQHQKRDRFLQD